MDGKRPFRIRPDHASGVLRAKLEGFWTLAITQDYIGALRSGAKAIARPHEVSRWLIDLRDFPVQSREVAAHMAENLQALSSEWKPYAAVIVSQTLTSLQTKNVAPQAGHRVFFSPEEAEAWLREQA